MKEFAPTPDDLMKILRGVDFSSELTERDRLHRTEVRRVLLSFLEVLDALDRAVATGQVTGTLVAVRKQLIAAFEQAGVNFLKTLGQPFDPSWHRALEARPGGEDHPVIVEEIMRGCTWNGELLRPAGVIIARSTPADPA